MAHVTMVKRALRALAYESDGDENETTAAAHARLVARATEALAAVDDAARFCESDGVTSLQGAVRQAEERDERHLRRRGRRTLSILQAYRAAADGENVDPVSRRASDDDHFHSGRGTPLPGAGQGGDR